MPRPSQHDQERARASAARAIPETISESEEGSQSSRSDSSGLSKESVYKHAFPALRNAPHAISDLSMSPQLWLSRGAMARWLVDVDAQQPRSEDRKQSAAETSTTPLRQANVHSGYGTLEGIELSYNDMFRRRYWHVSDEKVAVTEVEDEHNGWEACRACDSPWQVALLTIVVLSLVAMSLWAWMPARESVANT